MMNKRKVEIIVIVKKMLKNLAIKGVNWLYKLAEKLWADGTVQESLKIVNATATEMGVLDYNIQVLMPQWHEKPRMRAYEVTQLAMQPLGITYPDVKIVRVNLFLLSMGWFGLKSKNKILEEVRNVAAHEFRHAQQFSWIDSRPNLREEILKGYSISVFNWRYWKNPLETDARRYAKTGEDVPFEVVFKDYLK